MYPRKLTRSIISNPDYPVVETKAGKLQGLWEEGVFLFRGRAVRPGPEGSIWPSRWSPWKGDERGPGLRPGVQGNPYPHRPMMSTTCPIITTSRTRTAST